MSKTMLTLTTSASLAVSIFSHVLRAGLLSLAPEVVCSVVYQPKDLAHPTFISVTDKIPFLLTVAE